MFQFRLIGDHPLHGPARERTEIDLGRGLGGDDTLCPEGPADEIGREL